MPFGVDRFQTDLTTKMELMEPKMEPGRKYGFLESDFGDELSPVKCTSYIQT